MLTIENYHYSDERQRAVTDTYKFEDDELLEVEINIRYPIRIKVKDLKEALVKEELALNNDENFTPKTQEEFEKDPVTEETAIFYYLFRNLIKQMIEECYLEDEEFEKKMFEVLKNSEVIQILSDISHSMRVKALTETDLKRHTCCGPFPNLNLGE